MSQFLLVFQGMKKTLISCVLLLWCYFSMATIDTLRHYNTNANITGLTWNISPYTVGVGEMARFILPAPGELQEVIFMVVGNAGTSGTVEIFGQEAGTAFPQVFDAIHVENFSKSSNGLEQISVLLSNPVSLDNNQFFVSIKGNGIRLVTDGVGTTPQCTSGTGGDYGFQSIHSSGGTFGWGSGLTQGFVVEAIVDFPTKTSQQLLVDRTDDLGISTTLSSNRMAAADYNDDGLVDLLINGDLYENKGNLFEEVTVDRLGIERSPKANLLFDINNDGHLDILFLHDSDSSFAYMNDGNGYFSEVYLPEVPPVKVVNNVSVADINNDGYPDFYLGQLWTNNPNTYGSPNADPKYLFINDGNGHFVNQTSLLYGPGDYHGKCRGSQFVDYNNDGYLDLYVANYVTTLSRTTSPRDELWVNNGNGTFTNVIASTVIDNNNGTDFWNMSTGCHWADYDNDGDMDLLAPTLSHPHYMNGANGEDTRPTTIYENSGAPSYDFIDLAGTHNIAFEETHAGACWGDVNNDGLLDFFVNAFYGCRYAEVYVQQPDHSFEIESFHYGMSEQVSGADALWFDYNKDGKLDLLAANVNKAALYENQNTNIGNFVAIKPISTTTNHFAIGARVHVYAGGQVYIREVTVGRGQKMQDPYVQHVGLGALTTIDSVVVQWPGDVTNTTTFTGIDVNNCYQLVEDGTVVITTGVEKHESSATMMIYPNPFEDQINISANWSEQTDVAIHVYNISGDIVWGQQRQMNAGQNQMSIDLSEMSAGIYLITMIGDEGTRISKRIVKE